LHYQYIQEQSQLDEFLQAISTQSVLAIDTEFMRRRTLYPEIALIQVFDGQHLGLIDPCCDLDLSRFWQIMSDAAILKVLHSPSEDVEVFLKHGCIPSPIFDTQFALSLLGGANCLGFAIMVERFLGLTIDKSESRTNWLQRPLSASQLEYAAGDVFYLLPCFEKIRAEIEALGFMNIVIGEGDLLVTKRAYQTPDEMLHIDINNSWQLQPAQLAVLNQLAVWRRDKAREKNLALGFILKEPTLFEIARRQPQSMNQLRTIAGIEPMEINKSGKQILQCVEAGLAAPVETHPLKVTRLIDYPDYKKSAKLIKQKITKVAEKVGVPVDVFASKKQINQLLSWHWKLNEQNRSHVLIPDLMTGWRSELLGETLKEWHD
jgi:ribonuclease D